jgi:bifunctional enzyme CysN/CysC
LIWPAKGVNPPSHRSRLAAGVEETVGNLNGAKALALDSALKIIVFGEDAARESRLVDRLPRGHAFIDASDEPALLQSMAAGAEVAILALDAGEGFGEKARRRAYLLHLLGIGPVAVAVTQMERVDFDQGRFAEVARAVAGYSAAIDRAPVAVVPVSARDGDNIAERSARMAWYEGATVLEALGRCEAVSAPAAQPLRFPVRDARKLDGRRVLAGRVESGVLRVGDRLLFSPSNKIARVRSIEVSEGDPAPPHGGAGEARAGESIALTLEDPLFIERGEVASHEDQPPQLSTVFRATLCWLAGTPLEVGQRYTLKLATHEGAVTVQSIEGIVDIGTLARRPGNRVEPNAVAEVVLRSRRVLALDEHRSLARCGRFVLLEGETVVAGGIVSMKGYPDQRQALEVRATNVTNVEHRVAAASRAQRDGHLGGVLWFTGLSSAGKSTLAMEVEQRLFIKGYHVYVLDGDNVRRGLNVNLGFTPGDRAENIRRVGEVAALFADAGFICISAFISPYRADRERARHAAGEAFHEIFIDADLETCERRDPKGLYKKARAGEIADFTGVSAPYEAPTAPELRVDTANHSIDECIAQILEYVESAFALTPAEYRAGARRKQPEPSPTSGR